MWYNRVMEKTAFFAWPAVGLLVLVSAGCWTFGESPYPSPVPTPAAGSATNLVVKVDGFEASFAEYEVVHGYGMAYVPGYVGYRYARPGFYESVHTYTYVPTLRATDMFRRRAKEALEDAGFLASSSASPDYIVECRFGGPLVASGDVGVSWSWRLLTLFFCDYDAQSWTATLRIRDNRTGRVAFHHDYVQRYETKVFGLVPIFGIASCEQTAPTHMKSWCLSALTDRVVADATAFLVGRQRP